MPENDYAIWKSTNVYQTHTHSQSFVMYTVSLSHSGQQWRRQRTYAKCFHFGNHMLWANEQRTAEPYSRAWIIRISQIFTSKGCIQIVPKVEFKCRLQHFHLKCKLNDFFFSLSLTISSTRSLHSSLISITFFNSNTVRLIYMLGLNHLEIPEWLLE